MTNKKSGFWTFIFSLIPGAGEMYMGFFKHGSSVMITFFAIICIAGSLNLPIILFLLPVLWFYSFFHVHNLKHLPDEEFYALEDELFFPFTAAENNLDMKGLMDKYRKPTAIILILLGLSTLWKNFYGMLNDLLPVYLQDILWHLTYRLPQFAVGFLILAAGIYLITGKKKELEQSFEEESEDIRTLEDKQADFTEKEEQL